jgi:hypothetical protein
LFLWQPVLFHASPPLLIHIVAVAAFLAAT